MSQNTESVPDSSDEFGNIFQTVVVKGGVTESFCDVSGNTDESVPDSLSNPYSFCECDESGNTVVNESVTDSSSDESGNMVVTESVIDSSSDESGNTVVTESVIDSSSDESGNMCHVTAVGGGVVKSERKLRRGRRWGVRKASDIECVADLQPQISAHPWVLPPWPPPP